MSGSQPSALPEVGDDPARGHRLSGMSNDLVKGHVLSVMSNDPVKDHGLSVMSTAAGSVSEPQTSIAPEASVDAREFRRQSSDAGELKPLSFGATQIEECQDLFDMFDRDGSGWVDRKEFGPMMRTLGLRLTEKELDLFFAGMDESGDGKLEFPELIGFLEKVAQPITLEEELTEAFCFFDPDEESHLQWSAEEKQASVLDQVSLHQTLMGMGEDTSEEECADLILAATGGQREIDFRTFQHFVQPGSEAPKKAPKKVQLPDSRPGSERGSRPSSRAAQAGA